MISTQLLRVANCSSFKWGTTIFKWGTLKVQNPCKCGTSVGYTIFSLTRSCRGPYIYGLRFSSYYYCVNTISTIFVRYLSRTLIVSTTFLLPPMFILCAFLLFYYSIMTSMTFCAFREYSRIFSVLLILLYKCDCRLERKTFLSLNTRGYSHNYQLFSLYRSYLHRTVTV